MKGKLTKTLRTPLGTRLGLEIQDVCSLRLKSEKSSYDLCQSSATMNEHNSKTCCKRFDILIQNLLQTVQICQTEILWGNVSFTNHWQSTASNNYSNTRQMSVTDNRERWELTTHPSRCEGLGWVLLLTPGRPPDLNRRNPGHGPGILADKPEDR